MVQYPSKMHANKQLLHSRNWKWLSNNTGFTLFWWSLYFEGWW